MVCTEQSARADASPSQNRANTSTCVGSRSLFRIIGTTALLLLATSSAFGEFLVQPIILNKQVWSDLPCWPLQFEIENLSTDATEHVSLRIVDLAKDANGIWMEAPSDDPNRQMDGSALPSCRDWLARPFDALEVAPRQRMPLLMWADIPADANGFYYAALIAEPALQASAIDGPYEGAPLRIQYLVPIILEAHPMPLRDISGQVIDSEGKPVAGAQVALGAFRRPNWVIIDPPVLRPVTDLPGTTSEIVETDAEGRFFFAAVRMGGVLVASHERGFARVDVFDPTMSTVFIELEPWGQIEGTLYVGRKPAGGGFVYVRGDPRADLLFVLDLRYEPETRVEPDGRFAIRRVLPGRWQIGQETPVGRQEGSAATFSWIQRAVCVKPGETVKVRIGGTGRPVIGKLVLPEDSNRPPGMVWGEGFFDLTTGDGRAIDANAPSYSFKVESNGRFRIEDVTPGRYKLGVAVYASKRYLLRSLYYATIGVPPMQETYLDEPLDLGEVVLRKDY